MNTDLAAAVQKRHAGLRPRRAGARRVERGADFRVRRGRWHLRRPIANEEAALPRVAEAAAALARRHRPLRRRAVRVLRRRRRRKRRSVFLRWRVLPPQRGAPVVLRQALEQPHDARADGATLLLVAQRRGSALAEEIRVRALVAGGVAGEVQRQAARAGKLEVRQRCKGERAFVSIVSGKM